MSDYALTVLIIVIPLAVFGAAWLSGLPKLRARRMALLSNSQERLKVVTAELMEKANDLDQHIKYAGKSAGGAEKAKIKSALDDLLILSETLPTIDQLIEENRIDDVNDMLSAASQLAEKINGLLGDVKRGLGHSTEPKKLTANESASKQSQVIDVEVVE